MGVTVREKDGAWWIFVNHQKKRKAKRIGPGSSGRKAAETAAEKIQAKLALGDAGFLEEPTSAAVPTFEEVATQWERFTAPTWKRGTVITYGSALKVQLLPAFGALPITEVTPDRVEEWWTKAREHGYSKKHLGNLRAVFKQIMRRAIGRGLIGVDPSVRIEGRLGRHTGEVRPTTYLAPAELEKFLTTAKARAPREHPIFLVMATCGLRIGEAVALQVGDLDVTGLRLHVRRTVRRGYVDSPKSGTAGVVDVPPSTMAVLAEIRDIRQAEAAVDGREARWLFPGDTPDLPITPESVGDMFRRVLKVAGLRHVRPHDLRHTYATLTVQSGVPLLTVSRQLRHKDISTTANIYAHAVPGSNRAAADAMEAILAGNQTQPPRNRTA